ncbi:MAG: helix-turn-helix domain-containing protein [Gammaproteobacteria bacterium]|nr:helix-turn-helix domain-containing protein [Gammaproteobacteria bacterium]
MVELAVDQGIHEAVQHHVLGHEQLEPVLHHSGGPRRPDPPRRLFPATDISLPLHFPAAGREPRDTEGLVAELLDAGEGFEAVEAAMFREAVRRCGGNHSEAAKRLGLTRDTL